MKFHQYYLLFTTRNIPYETLVQVGLDNPIHAAASTLKGKLATWLQLLYNPAVQLQWAEVTPSSLSSLFEKPPKYRIVSCWHARMLHILFSGDKIFTFNQYYGIKFCQQNNLRKTWMFFCLYSHSNLWTKLSFPRTKI